MVSKKIDIIAHSVDETRKLGQKIGTLIKQPLVIALIGDLGSGKTAFVQGLACGLEVPDGYYITSPTFTLINEYPGRHPLAHVDLYRLEDIHDFEDLGLDSLDIVDLVVALQKKFKVQIRGDQRVREIRTFGDISNYVVALKKEASGS